MTNDRHDDAFPGIDDDPWDPIVAERFALLDRATPPTRQHGLGSAATSAEAIPVRDRARTPWVMAVASSIVVLAGLSVVALSDRGGGTGIEATDDQAGLQSTGRLQTADEDARGQGSTSSLVVSVDPAPGADAPSSTGSPTGDGSDRPGAVTTEVPEPSDTATTASTAAPTPGPVSTAPTSGTVAPTTTTTSRSTSMSVSLIPEKDAVTTVRGTATEVFTDCRSHLALDDQGAVVNRSPVSCDGGSWVVVDGNRIQTSSGFVSSDQAYDKHLADLQPGQSVTAVALRTARGLTLECVQCGLRLGG